MQSIDNICSVITYEEWKQNLTPKQKDKISKFVDKTAKSDIMKSGSDTVAKEEQRYGRNKSTVINKSYIESGEYRRKFDKLTNDPEINRTLYNKAKEMLYHRSGTLYEDMYWIDGSSGDVIASALNEAREKGIQALQTRDKNIAKLKNVIALHTHPESMPPSESDFNSYLRHNYDSAYIICHNGKIFKYSSTEQIDKDLYNAYIIKYLKNGYDDYEAQVKALERIKINCDINYWEVK